MNKARLMRVFQRASVTWRSSYVQMTVAHSHSTYDGQQKDKLIDSMSYCRDMVRKHDYEGFLCTLLLPAHARHTCMVLRAVNVELSLLREQIERWSGSAEAFRLQFWLDVIDSVFHVKKGPVPRQPIITALQSVSDQCWLHPLLIRMVEARRQTLGDKPFADVPQLYAHGHDTHGVLIEAAVRCITSPSDDSPPLASDVMERVGHLSKALALTQLCRSVLPLVNKGVWLIPDTLMQQHKCHAEKVCRHQQKSEFLALGRHLHSEITANMKSITDSQNNVPKELRPAFLPLACVRAFERRFRASDFNLLSGNLSNPYPGLALRLYVNCVLRRF